MPKKPEPYVQTATPEEFIDNHSSLGNAMHRLGWSLRLNMNLHGKWQAVKFNLNHRVIAYYGGATWHRDLQLAKHQSNTHQ